MMPTTLEASRTTSAPIPFSAISFRASKTDSLGPMDQTSCPLLSRMSPTFFMRHLLPPLELLEPRKSNEVDRTNLLPRGGFVNTAGWQPMVTMTAREDETYLKEKEIESISSASGFHDFRTRGAESLHDPRIGNHQSGVRREQFF